MIDTNNRCIRQSKAFVTPTSNIKISSFSCLLLPDFRNISTIIAVIARRTESKISIASLRLVLRFFLAVSFFQTFQDAKLQRANLLTTFERLATNTGMKRFHKSSYLFVVFLLAI